MRGNTYTEYIDYFKTTIVGGHAGLKSFYRVNPEHLKSELEESVEFPLFMLQRLDNKYMDSGADSVLKQRRGGFYILIKVGEKDNFEAEDEAYNYAESLAEDVISKMRDDDHGGTCFWKEFNINNIEEFHVGPLYDNCYGVWVQFDLVVSTKQNLFKDVSIWQ